MSPLATLTSQQARVVREAQSFFKAHGREPSISELSQAVDRPKASVHSDVRDVRVRYGSLGSLFEDDGQRVRLDDGSVADAAAEALSSLETAAFSESGGEAALLALLAASLIDGHARKGERGLEWSSVPPDVGAELAPFVGRPGPDVWQGLDDEARGALGAFARAVSGRSFHEVVEVLWPVSLEGVRTDKGKSRARRRRNGVYLTPTWLARQTTRLALRHFLLDNGVSGPDVEALDMGGEGRLSRGGRDRVAALLRSMSVVDPACGVGSFLHEAVGVVRSWWDRLYPDDAPNDHVSEFVASSVYGVDRDPLAVALTRTVLAYQGGTGPSGRVWPSGIRVGDALLGPPLEGAPFGRPAPRLIPTGLGLDWDAAFPDRSGGFDVVVGNPPWEKVKLITREFFEVRSGDLATAPTAADRALALEGREGEREALASAREKRRSYARSIRESGSFPLSSGGDMNLYGLFVERGLQLLSGRGVFALIVPSGLASDLTMGPLFGHLREGGHLREFLDFENRKKVFPHVDGRQKFAVVAASATPSRQEPEFAFFLKTEDDLGDGSRRMEVPEAVARVVNPLTGAVPICRSPRDLDVLVQMHERWPALDAGDEAQDWAVTYRRLFDMTNDSKRFVRWDDAVHGAQTREDGLVESGGGILARVYEGRMVNPYDHRAASSVERVGRFRRPAASVATTDEEHADPSHLARPRYLIPHKEAERRLQGWRHPWAIGFMDIGSSTNRRTMIAALLPPSAAGNKVPLLLPEGGAASAALLLANLNSLAYDFALRQHIGGITLNKYIVDQCPVVPRAAYAGRTVDGVPATDWVLERVAELSYTATDLGGWASEAGVQSDPFVWDSARRRRLQIDLDAFYFRLYGLSDADAAHVLDSFPIVRKHEVKAYGRYALREDVLGRLANLDLRGG